MSGPSARIVDLVWSRDEGSCTRCGRGLQPSQRGIAWSVHHRSPRGMGGSKTSWINAPSNLILLCGSGTTGCHGWVESNRDVARESGWLVPRNGVLVPRDVPVLYGDGLWFLWDDGGKYREPPF